MTDVMNGLHRVTKRDVKDAVNTLVAAFYDYPEPVFLMPDPVLRRKQLPGIYGSVVKGTLDIGEVWATSPSMEGVLVWTQGDGRRPVWKHGFSVNWLLMNLRHRSPPEGKREAYFSYVTGVRERLMPGRYWYLQMVGVAPALQGRGYGSRLLKPLLARAEQESLPVYLETQLESNVQLYERYGFNIEDDSFVPGTGIRSWAMVRKSGR
jgi:GNAT superfamily N-acetyltransferase